METVTRTENVPKDIIRTVTRDEERNVRRSEKSSVVSLGPIIRRDETF